MKNIKISKIEIENFKGIRRLTLDLGGVSFMDSSGIAILLRAYRRMQDLDGALRVVHVPQQAARVLRAAGLDKLIELE